MRDDIIDFGCSYDAAENKQEFWKSIGKMTRLKMADHDIYINLLDSVNLLEELLNDTELYVFNNLCLTDREKYNTRWVEMLNDYIIEQYIEVRILESTL